jgi:hypothetical protein
MIPHRYTTLHCHRPHRPTRGWSLISPPPSLVHHHPRSPPCRRYHSARDPPHEQLLVRLEAGVVSFVVMTGPSPSRACCWLKRPRIHLRAVARRARGGCVVIRRRHVALVLVVGPPRGGSRSPASQGVPVVVRQKHRDPPCGRVQCHPSVCLNRVVFPVSTRVGWVSNDVAGLQRCVGTYFAGIPIHGSPSILLHPPGPINGLTSCFDKEERVCAAAVGRVVSWWYLLLPVIRP